MSIINYGKKLIKEGFLTCSSTWLKEPDYCNVWAPDFMESITFIKAKKNGYESSLHFFWQSIFHQREVVNNEQAEELFASTQLIKVTTDEAVEKIKNCCIDWYERNNNLIPNPIWLHIIWEDDHDVAILFEDDSMYYFWGWDITS